MCDTAGLTLSFLNECLCGHAIVISLQSLESSLEGLQISTHFFFFNALNSSSFIRSHLQETFKGINPPAAVFLRACCVKYELQKGRRKMCFFFSHNLGITVGTHLICPTLSDLDQLKQIFKQSVQFWIYTNTHLIQK